MSLERYSILYPGPFLSLPLITHHPSQNVSKLLFLVVAVMDKHILLTNLDSEVNLHDGESVCPIMVWLLKEKAVFLLKVT